MPTYEYECATCKKNFDVFQSMKDEPLKKCPTCGGRVKRLIGTGAGIIFKGGGFYQTDYRSNSYQSSAKADSSSSTSSAASTSSSATETAKTDKPAAPAATSATTPTPAASRGAKGKGKKKA
jgi:putative FmdB family regulatory protein